MADQVREKRIAAAVESQTVVIVSGVENVGDVGGQRCATLHQGGEYALKGTPTDFDGKGAAVGGCQQVMLHVGGNDGDISRTHEKGLPLHCMAAASLQRAGDFEEIVPVGGNVDVAGKGFDLSVGILCDEKFLQQRTGVVGSEQGEQILLVPFCVQADESGKVRGILLSHQKGQIHIAEVGTVFLIIGESDLFLPLQLDIFDQLFLSLFRHRAVPFLSFFHGIGVILPQNQKKYRLFNKKYAIYFFCDML